MLSMEQGTGPMEMLTTLGRQVGLTQAEVDRATERLTGAFSSLMATDKPSASFDVNRLVSGLGKNLLDNPMLVAWGLKVAARTGDEVFSKFIGNFLKRSVVERKSVVDNMADELGYHPPSTILINPTMRCNLRCKGCYAYSFDQKADMDRDVIERILLQAKDLGIHFITMTGGEPFLYPEIEDIFQSHPDITFMVYTNAQRIDAARAQRLAKLGNVWPTISVEGYETETDERRGKGVYAKLIETMGHLKDAGVLFGISAVPTRHNTDMLASDEFLDHYIDQGALFGWMFTYMPVGKDPDIDLMATPAQREQLRRQSLHWRQSKPFFMSDFWNDGPLCGGCMSASRIAFITTDGWVQPCVFVQFATHNVHEHSLRDIFDSEFFHAIRGRQPYHPNFLRPCKIIDHPHVLREVVEKCGARPTYPGADSIIKDQHIRDHLDNYSQEYAEIAEKTWNSEDYEGGHSVQVPFYGRSDLYKIYEPYMRRAHAQVGTPMPSCSGKVENRPKKTESRIKIQ